MPLPFDRFLPLNYYQRQMFRRMLVRQNANIIKYATSTEQVTDAMVDMVTYDMFKEFNAAKKAVNSQVAGFFERYGINEATSLADVVKYGRLSSLEAKIDNILDTLKGYTTKATKSIIEDVYQETFYRQAFGIQNSLEVALSFSLLPEKQILGALANPYDRIGWEGRSQRWIDFVSGQIKQEVTQGIIQGKSYSEIASEINKRTGMAMSRAETIARTEAGRARSLGNQHCLEHAYRQGVEMDKIWVATLDDNTRDTHRVLDQQDAPVFDHQGNPGTWTSALGNETERPRGFGVAEEDINCRCTMRGQVAGFRTPSSRWARGVDGKGEFIPYDDYESYAKDRGWPTKADDLGVFDAQKAVKTVDQITEDFVEQILQGYEYSIYHLPNEWCHVLSPDGTHLKTHTSDSPDHVNMNTLVKNKIVQGNILTHNHPQYSWMGGPDQVTSGSLSEQDIMFAFKYHLTEMRAVGWDGRIFSIKPDPEFWFSPAGQHVIEDWRYNAEPHFASWHHAYYRPQFRSEMGRLIESGEYNHFNQDEIAHIATHNAIAKTAHLLGYNYEQYWSDWQPESERIDYTNDYVWSIDDDNTNYGQPAIPDSMYTVDPDTGEVTREPSGW